MRSKYALVEICTRNNVDGTRIVGHTLPAGPAAISCKIAGGHHVEMFDDEEV